MIPSARRVTGFTLLELMITITVIIVLMMLAVPSFQSFRQRSALRGAAEQTLGFVNQARMEAAKRNEMVKFGVVADGAKFCLGAATTTTAADDTPCDCFDATACNVARFPGDPVNGQGEWKGVTWYVVDGTTPTLGGGDAVAVIEPKRAALATPAQAGLISLAGPPGPNQYRLNVNINTLGRGIICESSNAADAMSDYIDRRCAP
jgi:Tfp pilus assembly protein FimT